MTAAEKRHEIERGGGRPVAYKLADGTKVPSVTTILKARTDASGLIGWAMREGHRAEILKDEAAAVGTLVHDYAEALIHGDNALMVLATGLEELPAHSRDEARAGAKAADKWLAQATHLRFEATEIALVSERYRFAGTFDWLAHDKRADCTVIGDWKTSKRFYVDNAFQLGAYAILLEDVRGITAPAGMVVRLPKDGSPASELSFAGRVMEEARAQFLRLYKAHLMDKKMTSFFGLNRRGKR